MRLDSSAPRFAITHCRARSTDSSAPRSISCRARLHEVVTYEDPIDGRASRQWGDPEPLELVCQPARSPSSVGAPQLADLALDLRGELPGMTAGTMRTVDQAGEAALAILVHPGVHGSARHPIALGDFRLLRARQNLHDCVIALLHDAQ